MKSMFVCLSGLLLFSGAIVVSGAEIYISPTGNDASNGTMAAPLATIAAARDNADLLI